MYISRVVTPDLNAVEASDGHRRRDAVRTRDPKASRSDAVEFSGAARALAKQYSQDGLTPARIRDLRMQIESGAYNKPEFIEELAWRLIETGIV